MWTSLWTHLLQQLKHSNFGNIHTTENRTRFCAWHGTKMTTAFYLLMEKSLGQYFQFLSSYYQLTQCNQKTLILVSWRWQVRSEKAKNRNVWTLIKATTSVHLPKPVSTDNTKRRRNHTKCLFKNPLSAFRLWPLHIFYQFFYY